MVTIQQLLQEAADMDGSDLHLSVGTNPKVRVRGKLVELPYEILKPEHTLEMASSLLTESKKAAFLKTGESDFSYTIQGLGRFRVNLFRQRSSVSVVIRLVNSIIPTPDQLGLLPSVVDLTNRKRGLVLVTGPTGSGKSTTLASLINIINSKYENHIITLEDPIEYVHRHKKSIVNQREVGLDTQSYAVALRAALREDPDVILVGEMRDLETISTAITAAETGHLVFSTLHTIGAAPTIDRIIDVFPPHQQQQVRIQLAMLLEAIVSQQLLRTADGKGRVAAFEVMLTNSAISNLIREAKTHQVETVIQTNRRKGMIIMDDYLLELYLDKRITKSEAIAYARDPVALKQRFT